MSEVHVIVEGKTEQQFLEAVLSPYLANFGVYLTASSVSKPGGKGGNRYDNVKRDVQNSLKQRSDTFVSTMFDYYGMIANDWLGKAQAIHCNQQTKPLQIERAIKSDIESSFQGINKERFFPYVQMHEFEAILFVWPQALANACGILGIAADLENVRRQFSTPEEINDSPNTAPSKRIHAILSNYSLGYEKKKIRYGLAAAKQIAIEDIRKVCPHFNSWIEKLLSTATIQL